MQAFAERSGLIGVPKMPAPDLAVLPQHWIFPSASIAAAPCVASAERVGPPPRWNRDPKTGIEAPLEFGKTLDCDDRDLVGDIEYLRQPNRHEHLVTLAQAYALAGHERHGAAIAEHVESWVIACPYGRGANWSSALEVARRLVSWSAAWQLVGGAHSRLFARHAGLRAAWLRAAFEHAHFIRGWLSVHSKEAQRLAEEAGGLFLGALAWPHWPQAREWRATAKRVLADTLLRHGAGLAVLELLLVCLLAGKANREWFSPVFETQLEALLDLAASTAPVGASVPLLAVGAVLFRRGDFKLKAGALDDKARWLLGPRADALYAELDVEKTRLPLRQGFPQAGTYVLGAEFDTPREIRLVARTGALDCTLSVGGREWLVDPGTWPETGANPWRRYFNSGAARNGVRIDGRERAAAPAGCSLWLSGAHTDSFEGWHDGYRHLDDPVMHRRLVQLDKAARRVVIEDTLEMEEDHEVELFFHCHDACLLEPVEDGFRVIRADKSLRLVLPQADQARTLAYTGSLSPVAGWMSRGFDQRVPAPTIVWQARLTGRSVLRSEILLYDDEVSTMSAQAR